MEIISESPFFEVAAILVLAATLASIGRVLKQPVIVTFIAVGILVGPEVLNLLRSEEQIETLAELGIAILLFIVGLKLDLKLIRSSGTVALMTGVGQIVFTAGSGFLISLLLGFTTVHAVYIALALTFSSTVIIVKMLSDKKDVDKLHGQIAMGILIIQDIVVIVAMIVLSAFGGEGEEVNIWNELLMVVLKGFAFIAVLAILMKYAIPAALKKLAQNQELLVLSSIAWAVALAAIGEHLGFGMEVGAFLAGISLASTEFREVISGRLTSIRDFMLLFFFIDLGSQIELSVLGEQIVPALLLSLLVLVGKPVIVLVIMGALGYKKKVSFMAGITLAQISEFSLILGALGMENGHIEEETLGLITLVGLITISLSTYLITYTGPLYKMLAPMLEIFEKKDPNRGEEPDEGDPIDFIIIGVGRLGHNLAENLLDKGHELMIVDFDPKSVAKWKEKGIRAEYSDAEDPELPSLLPISRTRHIISTAPDLDTNIRLLKFMQEHNYDGKVTAVAHSNEEEEILRKNGAYQVMRPFLDTAQIQADKVSPKG